jgi:hypothetical protein
MFKYCVLYVEHRSNELGHHDPLINKIAHHSKNNKYRIKKPTNFREYLENIINHHDVVFSFVAQIEAASTKIDKRLFLDVGKTTVVRVE